MIWRLGALEKMIRDQGVKTLTLDVFDTIFLRKVYPEDLQFIEHGKKAVQILKHDFDLEIDPQEFYGWRKFFRQAVDESKVAQKFDREARLEEMFEGIFEAIMQKYEVSFSQIQKETVLQEWILAELEGEKKYLVPRVAFIKFLRAQKAAGIKLFFVSDIYLSRDHLWALFRHFKIDDLFTDGICSADIGYCKGTGRLFEKIESEKLLEINIFDNLHVGDSYFSDFLSPQSRGFQAVHLVHFHYFWRNVNIGLGRMKMAFIKWKYRQGLKKKTKAWTKQQVQNLSARQKTAYAFGQKCAPALLKYLASLDAAARIHDQPVYWLSSEGQTMDAWFKLYGSSQESHILPSWNRIRAMRSYGFLSLSRPTFQNFEATLWHFARGEGKDSLEKWLASIGITREELEIDDVGLKIMTPEQFLKNIKRAFRKNKNLLKALGKSHTKLLGELQSTSFFNHEKVILADLGWSGTIQILMDQVLDLLGKGPETHGRYMGTTGKNFFGVELKTKMHGEVFSSAHDPMIYDILVEEIWEYLAIADEASDERLVYIKKGIEDFLSFWRTELSADPNLVFQTFEKNLVKAFRSPTKLEAGLLGAVVHEAGFGSDVKRPIVNLGYSRAYIWFIMVFHPRKFMTILRDQYWVAGFLSWYGLSFLEPLSHYLRRKKGLY